MSKDVEKLFNQAQQLHQAGQLPQAISAYEMLLNEAPHHAEALHLLGLAHAQLDDMQRAIDYLNRAIELKPNEASFHNHLANAYKKSHTLDKAIEHYQKAVNLISDYAEAHNNLAAVYALQGNYQKALEHYRLAVHAKPEFVVAHYNLGLLLLRTKQLAAAKKQFQNVLILKPYHINAQFYLGVLYLEDNKLDKASDAFNNVLAIDSEHADALANLGVIALKHKKDQLAVDYFTKALALDNDNIDARNNLAATFIHNDRFENALMHYDVLLKQEPHNIEYLYNAGVAQMALGHLQEAITHFEIILNLQDDHFATLNNLAAINIRLGHKDKAVQLLQHALAANPADEASQFMLNALTGHEKNPAACPTYVGHLFDNYALYYDKHLQSALHYSLPHHIGRLLHKLEFTKVKRALDLGCGTGLCGPVLRGLCDELVGVDISAKMLAEANKKGIYDKLVEAELLAFLAKNKKPYNLSVASDVLPYLGELNSLFTALSRCLVKQSLFIFSHEISESASWELQASARFSHHPDYIKELCMQHKFEVIAHEKVVARHQQEEPVFVLLWAVRASSKN